jgi:hypothetical protein
VTPAARVAAALFAGAVLAWAAWTLGPRAARRLGILGGLLVGAAVGWAVTALVFSGHLMPWLLVSAPACAAAGSFFAWEGLPDEGRASRVLASAGIAVLVGAALLG